jgi:Arc/MetJ-type ribon-helix-helix transcriptional regulator
LAAVSARDSQFGVAGRQLPLYRQTPSIERGETIMKSMHVELPDKLADELNLLVEAGWFRNTDEAIRLALTEFVRHHRVELIDRFQRDDIAWALRQRGPTSP